MSAVAFQAFVILCLVLLNGVFAMSEIAVVSMRRARLLQRAEAGDTKARAALVLADAPNRFLSTIQIGITLVGVLAGAYGGATIAVHIAAALREMPALARYADLIGLGTAVVGTTYLSLVLGELVPKRIALQYAEEIARLVAPAMTALSRLSSPIVFLLSASTDAVLGVVGFSAREESPVTEDEIKILVRQGTVAGMIEEVERDMVERVFRLGEQQVSAHLMPRTEIVWLDISDPPERIRETISTSSYSRFPVARDSLDQVLGIVHVKDLLLRCMADEPLELEAVLQEPLYVPETMRSFEVLEQFKQAGLPMALVVDEYGVLQGLITLNDILEAIVGDIPEADQFEEPLAVQREDGSWLLDGLLPIDEFKDMFTILALPEEGDYQTLGGFVVAQLGRIPTAAERFEWAGLAVEVMDMDGNRVDKVLVSPIAGNEEA